MVRVFCRLILVLTLASCSADSGSSSSSSSPTPTPTATPTPTPGPFENKYSVAFDGINQYMSMGQPAALEFAPQGQEFTVSAWYKSPSAAVGSGAIISKALGATRQFQLSIAAGGTLEGRVGGAYHHTGVSVRDGNWHHVAIVNYNDAGTYKFQMYIDGVPVGMLFTTGPQTVAADWLIGARRNADNTDFAYMLVGSLDEVAIWSVRYTDADIQALYTQGSQVELTTTNPTGLVSWWRMGDASGDNVTTTINDSKSSNHATTFNMVSGSRVEDVP